LLLVCVSSPQRRKRQQYQNQPAGNPVVSPLRLQSSLVLEQHCRCYPRRPRLRRAGITSWTACRVHQVAACPGRQNWRYACRPWRPGAWWAGCPCRRAGRVPFGAGLGVVGWPPPWPGRALGHGPEQSCRAVACRSRRRWSWRPRGWTKRPRCSGDRSWQWLGLVRLGQGNRSQDRIEKQQMGSWVADRQRGDRRCCLAARCDGRSAWRNESQHGVASKGGRQRGSEAAYAGRPRAWPGPDTLLVHR
jgi:hypothetical protein